MSSWWLMRHDRPLVAGAALAFATALKPQVVLMIPLYIVIRSFGQLKPLWTAKVEGAPEGEGGQPTESAPAPETPPQPPASNPET